MDFRCTTADGSLKTVIAQKGSSTVIEAGDFVAIDTGLIIKATAASTALAYCPKGAPSGTTDVEVTRGNDFTLRGTADANFAVANRGAEVDLVVTDNVQLIDLGSSSTDVLKVSIAEDAGVVGSTANVEVKINKPIF